MSLIRYSDPLMFLEIFGNEAGVFGSRPRPGVNPGGCGSCYTVICFQFFSDIDARPLALPVDENRLRAEHHREDSLASVTTLLCSQCSGGLQEFSGASPGNGWKYGG
ncbi:MAG: hypothetical protein JOZ22_20155 [Acidobacteriia bacterium]|nr:hypothetical protein [Terriglobia bacterium]